MAIDRISTFGANPVQNSGVPFGIEEIQLIPRAEIVGIFPAGLIMNYTSVIYLLVMVF